MKPNQFLLGLHLTRKFGTKYSRMNFQRFSSTNFTWSILEYFVPFVLKNRSCMNSFINDSSPWNTGKILPISLTNRSFFNTRLRPNYSKDTFFKYSQILRKFWKLSLKVCKNYFLKNSEILERQFFRYIRISTGYTFYVQSIVHFQSKKTSHHGAMKQNLLTNLLTHYKTMM